MNNIKQLLEGAVGDVPLGKCLALNIKDETVEVISWREVNPDTSIDYMSYHSDEDTAILAYWCGPCKMLKPIFDKVAEEHEGLFLAINVDEQEEIAKKFGVMTLPTLVLIEDGEVVSKASQFMPKPLLEAFIGGK